MNSYVGNTPTTGHFPTDTFTSSGGSTYTLSQAPATTGSIEVSVQGVLQAVSAYTISGTTLTLAGVASGDVIFVRHLGETLQVPTPGDASVSTAKIVDDAVTTAKILDANVTTAKIAADAIDGTKLADNACNSEHYTDGSIDNAHLADDAVGVAELSATGTASSSTFLRGDNAWATPDGVTPKMKIINTSYAFSNAPGTQTISGVGFTPDAMYGEWGTGNSTFNGPFRFWAINSSSSLAQSGTNNMAGWQHNERQTAGTWEFKYNYAIWEKSWNNDFRATIAWNSDGITITYTENGTGQHTTQNMMCVFFKLT